MTTVAYIYDASGPGRWCIDCQADLGPDLETRRFNWMLFLPVWVALVILVAFFLVVNHGVDRTGPQVTPSTHPNPPVVHSIP